MLLRVSLIATVVLGVFLWWSNRSIDQPAGVLAAQQPVQTNLEKEEVFVYKDYTMTKLAHFEVTARVLSKERYWLGRSAALVPYDLALGWGRMSDSGVLEQISISQSGRFYHWMTSQFPIPREEISSCSANMHLIPSSRTIRKQLGKVRKGHVVHFSGYLVSAAGRDGWRWNTSMTRSDTGNGACELVWVDEFEIKD